MPRLNLRPLLSAVAGPSSLKPITSLRAPIVSRSLLTSSSTTRVMDSSVRLTPSSTPQLTLCSIRSLHLASSFTLQSTRTSSILPSLRSRTPILPSPRITSARFVTYGMEYQPSQRKRKRSYGFLARKRAGKKGNDILKRRRALGRRFLSH